ncbi:MAG TPA: DegQ family serine endoprotease [Verrucomicrobiae bacterium]|nr:DegQ family serine endoprotease [Verrucomicrobiae bacterium]
MNVKKLQAIRLVTGIASFVAAGLIVFAADNTPPPVPSGDTAALRALADTFGAVASRVGPSVVTVYSEKVIKFQRPDFSFPFGDNSPFQWFFGDQNQQPQRPHPPRERQYRFSQSGIGSGIVIDKQGHILTNYHVVKEMDEIKVILPDKRTLDAEVVGTDPRSDLAVIKIKGDVPHDLAVATLGDSDNVRVGDWVIAIGAPFGFAQTITHGIISAKGRGHVGSGDNYEDFIQTDAAINPGNSGGPLVNLRGEVIGINTAIATSVGQFSGVGFAIPIEMARQILPTLLAGGKVRRGFLGLLIQDVDEDSAETFHLPDSQGALVKQVNDGTPAARAGVQPGDVIVRYEGKKIEDANHLRNLVAGTAPGSKVDLVVLRDGHERSLSATIGQLKTGEDGNESEAGNQGEESPNSSASQLGLTVEPLTAQNAKQYNLDEDDKGVVVTDVDQDSPAARADLRPGDLITGVDRTRVNSVAEFHDAMAKAKGKDRVLLNVTRQGDRHFVIVHPKDQ